jgi:hypothetical protein
VVTNILNPIVCTIVYVIVMPLVHEIGHICAIKMIGGKVVGVRFSRSFIRVRFLLPERFAYWKFLFFTCNGIIVQIIMTLILVVVLKVTTITIVALFYLSVIALNIVPISETDGAFIFKSFPSSWMRYFLWVLTICTYLSSGFGILDLWKQNYTTSYKTTLTGIYLVMVLSTLRRFRQLLEGDSSADPTL